MARKDTVRKQLESNKSLAAGFTTEPTITKFLDNLSYQISVSTTNSQGSFTVEVSNDYEKQNEQVVNSGTWVALVLGGGTPVVSAANDDILININQTPFHAIRLKYTSTVAGTGTCNVWIVAKQLGG